MLRVHVRFVRETVPFFRIVYDGRFGIGNPAPLTRFLLGAMLHDSFVSH